MSVNLTKRTPPPASRRNDLEALAWSPMIPTRVLHQTVRNDLEGLAAVFSAIDDEIVKRCGEWPPRGHRCSTTHGRHDMNNKFVVEKNLETGVWTVFAYDHDGVFDFFEDHDTYNEALAQAVRYADLGL